jgi:hypothetical protein
VSENTTKNMEEDMNPSPLIGSPKKNKKLKLERETPTIREKNT